jgi:hypothetical protein
MVRANTVSLEAYDGVLRRWMPKAEIRKPTKGLAPFGLIVWKGASGAVRFLVEEKRHLRHQDVAVVADQMRRTRETLALRTHDRLLLLAPHVRPQQAAVLERADIDFIDLAGNALLRAPGLHVHVEGRRPPKEPVRAPGRPQKGWIKTVMALLIRPELVDEPYRVVAEQADVALGTVAGCVNDLAVRGLLVEGKQGRRLADRPAVVALWVQAYIDGLRPRLGERRFQVRAQEKPEVWERLKQAFAKRVEPWALTGADAAERRTHFFRAEETEIYAPLRLVDDREVQKGLVAQPTGRGGNLLVIEPPGPLALTDTTHDGVPTAHPLLAYAELRYRGTGQALEAAEQLLPTVLTDVPD